MKKIITCSLFFLILISLAYAVVPDDDGDGVPDSEDKCDSLQGTTDSVKAVDTFGCDCDQKLDDYCAGGWCCEDDEVCMEYDFRARCMGDSDGDDVYDVYDRCSDTSDGESVDSLGCACYQKTCDDDNLCTDNYCDDGTAECSFVNNDDNDCGEGKRCEEGLCRWDEENGFSDVSYWSYDPEKHETRIFYSHSGHTIEVLFGEPFDEEVVVLDSTSDVISYDLSEDRMKLTLLVEGDPSVRGVTTIKTMQKPVSVTIDEVEIVEVKEKYSPRNYIWLYFLAILVMLVIIFVFILSQRRHEDEIASSIKKEEHKIEKEVDLEAELQLKMYIMANLRRGYTAQQIRDELLKDGWKKETLDRAFNSLRR